MKSSRKFYTADKYYQNKNKKMNLSIIIQEKASKLRMNIAPFFSNDILFNIFLLLPIKSLLRFSCVCKSWYKLIYSKEFTEAYNNQAESGLIFLKNVHSTARPNAFHVETQVNQSECFSLFPSRSLCNNYIHLFEVQDGKGKIDQLNISCSGSILATCNGLVLMNCRRKPGRLVVMNPMTRKFVAFPLGTIAASGESYGLLYGTSESVYKVVHLFRDDSHHIGCELLDLNMKSWRGVDGPSHGLIRSFVYAPVSAIGALHWVPDFTDIDYLVSFCTDEGKFSVTHLPEVIKPIDRVSEMGGLLSLLQVSNSNQVDVWVLKELQGAEWTKRHSINIDLVVGHVGNLGFTVPSFVVNGREMIFAFGMRFYSYDLEDEVVREVEMEGEFNWSYKLPLVHVNSLATWEPLEHMS